MNPQELKERFWKYYNGKGRALRYQFECPLFKDEKKLVTVEKYQGNYQFNCFEFAVEEMNHAIEQAKEAYSHVNKSWIVIANDDKSRLLNEETKELIKSSGLGLILVDNEGRYTIEYVSSNKSMSCVSQALLNLMMEGR